MSSIVTAEDRISALPDSLLCHILSFFPTKHAVATSILSKRWKPLWKSVLTLNVDEEDFKDFNSFRDFIYSVTVSRDAALPIRSFRISCGELPDFDPLFVNQFVLAAVQRGLQNFDLSFVVEYDLQKLAPSVLSCKTLVVLKLSHLKIDSEIPQLVDLPLLKTLHLDSIFIMNNFVDITKLFNGCPILEDLHLNDVKLYQDWHDSKEEFKFKDFKGFPNLVRANFCDCDLIFPFVWLYNATFMCVDVNEFSIDYRVPTFHNLTHLGVRFCGVDSWPQWVIQVLQCCPKLQNLTIEASGSAPPIEDIDWNDQETVPECLSSQLRTCSLINFKGFEGELLFAKYILLNSKLLHTMTIKSVFRYGNLKYQQLRKLASYPRGSATCQLLFD